MGDEQRIKLRIHYGGSMDFEDGDYSYLRELGCTTVFWNLSEISWYKFEDQIMSVSVRAPISLIWFKEARQDMKMMKYLFDKYGCDTGELLSSAKSVGEMDVFIEHECSEHFPVTVGADMGLMTNEEDVRTEEDVDGGYEPGEDKRMVVSDDDDIPPKEDDDPDDSEDEEHADNDAENPTEVDDGDEVVEDAGNGAADARFQALFDEAEQRDRELDEASRKFAKEEAAKSREDEEVTDPEFEEDVGYPSTPLGSDEEWEQWKNPQKEKVDQFHYDLTKEPYIWFFQTFNSGLGFKDQLLRYSLNTQHDIKMARSSANRIATICCNANCNWYVYCSFEPRLNKWLVKTYRDKHNHAKSSRVSMLKQSVIAGLFREEIRRNANLPAAEIKDIIKERYNIVVSLSKCYKGRRIALDSVLEAQSIQFGKLWDYEAELNRFNKDITTERLTADINGSQMFKGFYICFEEFRTNWQKYCRPVIGLDGCFLKWDLEGDILAAVGRDADNKMFPIAWAVVTGENKDTWGWFVQKLKKDLNLGTGTNITIISDKQKGLIHAIANELPQAEHRMCARHIYGNWKKTFNRSEYRCLFWAVAFSYHEGEYEEKMKLLHAYDPAAYNALLKIDPQRWCRAFFNPESRCADVHNNLSEAFNRTIKIARSKPVISMLEDIRTLAMTRVSRWFLKAEKLDSFLTPRTLGILEKARLDKKNCQTLRSSTYLYEVREFNMGYTVDLANHQCACRRWDITGIPCKHAVCVLDDNQADPQTYVAKYYQTAYLKNTYKNNIKPVNGELLWRKTYKPPIVIPSIRKRRGRRKTRDRRKEPFESLQNAGKSTRHGRIQHCSRCGQAGHIKSGCKNEAVVVEGPKNRCGRPRKSPAVEVQPLRQPKPRNPRAAPSTINEAPAAASSSQPVQLGQSSSQVPASSSAPQPSVSSNIANPKKRGRALKTTKVETVRPEVGTFYSPFTGRPFQVFGSDKSNNSQ